MAENPHAKKMTDIQSTDTTPPGDRTTASEGRSALMACGMGNKRLKGLLLMASCCGAPLLLLLALPLLGSVLGSRSAPVVSTLAVLACPVGMALMMWMMRRGQRAGAQQPIQEPPISVSKVARTAPPTPAVHSHQVAVVAPAGSRHEAVLPRQD